MGRHVVTYEMEPMLKSQTVRVLDIVFVGPAMIWAGVELREKQPELAVVLGFLGVATMGYNAWNFWRYNQIQDGAPPPAQLRANE